MTGTSFIPTMVAVIVIVRFKRFINRFRETGTTSPQTAKTLEELNLKHRFIFKRLLMRNVLIETYADRYYLDEQNLLKYNNKRRMIMFTVILALAILIIIDTLFLNNQ